MKQQGQQFQKQALARLKKLLNLVHAKLMQSLKTMFNRLKIFFANILTRRA
jgi:hypothetical protein